MAKKRNHYLIDEENDIVIMTDDPEGLLEMSAQHERERLERLIEAAKPVFGDRAREIVTAARERYLASGRGIPAW